MQLTEKHKEYWQKTLRMTGILLAIWFVATFVVEWFARELNAITFIGPLGFSFGKAMNSVDGDDTQFFQFSLGQEF